MRDIFFRKLFIYLDIKISTEFFHRNCKKIQKNSKANKIKGFKAFKKIYFIQHLYIKTIL